MELKLSYIEAQAIIAPKFNLDPVEVRISAPIGYDDRPYHNDNPNDIKDSNVSQALMVIFDEGKNLTSGGGKYVNKIALIKAIRTLTNASLKDAKDLADNIALPF